MKNDSLWILILLAAGVALYWIVTSKRPAATGVVSNFQGQAAQPNPLIGTSAAPAPTPALNVPVAPAYHAVQPSNAAVVQAYIPSPGLPIGTMVVNGQVYDQTTGDWLGEAPGASGAQSYTPQHLLVN